MVERALHIQEPHVKEAEKIPDSVKFQESGNFYARNCASIEVLRNGKLERIIFFMMSYCNYLPKESKIEFHSDVNRDSANAKITDLVN